MGLEPLHVCLNGHVEQQDEYGPRQRTPFCQECGDRIVAECQSCGKPLPIPDEFDLHPRPPAHCGYCGIAHIWTQRAKEAAIELFVEDSETTDEDVRVFKEEIEQISRDTPSAPLASSRIKKLLGKISAETAKSIRDILVRVVSTVIAQQLRSD